MAAALSIPGAVVAEAQEVAPRDTFAGETRRDLNPWPGLNKAAADLGVATYIGGDLQVFDEAAELEGLTLVRGDAIFDRSDNGLVNVGIVGAGAQVHPLLGSTMLAVGGDMRVAEGTRVAVGEGTDLSEPQGKLRVGGELDAAKGAVTSLETETDLGGEAFPEEFRGFDKDIAATQRFLSSLEGGADVTVGERQTDIEFGSDVLHGLQVATVEAASLNVAKEINLVGINPDGHAVINVVGGPLDLEITSILIGLFVLAVGRGRHAG